MTRPAGATDLLPEMALTAGGDAYGWCMSWWFACAETLDRNGEHVPDAWQYRAGAFGPPDPESYEDECAEQTHSEHGPAPLIYWGNVLRRYAHWCDLSGVSY